MRNFATIDATPAFDHEDYTYLKKSHKSLLMFRRTSSDGKLELRHQRTGDVVFNWKGKLYRIKKKRVFFKFNVYFWNINR